MPGTDRRCALLYTATNKDLTTFLFWTATKTNYISKCSDFQKKLIDTITTSNFYLKFKENNENDMTFVVWSGNAFGPRLWQLSARRRSFAGSLSMYQYFLSSSLNQK